MNIIQSKNKPLLILLIGIILLFFIGDVLKVTAKLFQSEFLLYTRASKVIGVIIIVVYILKYKLLNKKYTYSLTICLLLLTVAFVLGNASLLDVDFKNNLTANFIYFAKACFLPLFLIPFYSVNYDITKKGLTIIEYLFWINCVAIIIGFCFHIQSFQTYAYGSRFGYKGLFDRSTFVSYLFIFMIIFYYYKYTYLKKNKSLLTLMLAILISLLVGTKRIYIFLILLLIFHFFNSQLYRKKLFWVGFGVFILVFYFLIDNFVDGFQFLFKELISIYHTEGILSSITSYRNDLLAEYINTYVSDNWSSLNYIFGGGFFHQIRPELDLIDAYLFFGIFGPFVYIFLYTKYIFNFKIDNPMVFFFLSVIILLALTSSGIIFSANFAVLIILFSSYFYYENLKTKK